MSGKVGKNKLRSPLFRNAVGGVRIEKGLLGRASCWQAKLFFRVPQRCTHIVYRQLQRDSGFGRFFLCSLVTNELDFSIISLGENFGQVWISVSVTRRQLHAVARDDDSHDRALRLGASSRRRSTGLSQAHVRASRPCRERMRCVPSHVILSLLLPPLPPMRPNMALGRASCPPAIPPGRRSLRGEASQHRRR